MGCVKAFRPEKLVIAILTSAPERLSAQLGELTESFGEIDFRSDPIPFTFTSYYTEEMGPDIIRVFAAFSALVDPQSLAGIKIVTNALEDRWRVQGRRKTNLDPGLLGLSRFVLATTKDGSHRIPLAQGIYGEVTLTFEKGGFRPAPWTYPDYASAPYLEILNRIRAAYKEQLADVT